MDNVELFNNIVEDILTKYHINLKVVDIKKMYMVKYPNRVYHNLVNHIIPMIKSIKKDFESTKFDINIYDKLILATIFHDIVYDPKSKTNEKDSISYFLNHVTDKTNTNIIDAVETMILSTETQDLLGDNSILFNTYDLEILTKELPELLVWEKQIQEEYSFVNWSKYKKERIKVLNKLQSIPLKNININGLDSLIDIINSTTPKIGIYAGSFDPFHIGHMDILKKGENIFDKVIVAKGLNKKKADNTYRWNTEFKKLKKLLPNNEVIKYQGLLVDVIKEQKDVDVTLIRGLRNGYDLDAENTLTTFMKEMYPELKIVYISSEKDLEHISSSAIREIRTYDKKLVEKYLPIKN